MFDIDYYVWDWGNGECDMVYEVMNYFYMYIVDESMVCMVGIDFIVYNISFEIYCFCEEGQSCYIQIVLVVVCFKLCVSFDILEVVCVGEEFEFFNSSCAGDEFFWEFGDGIIFIELNFDYIFEENGIYEVILYVINECGLVFIIVIVEVIDSFMVNISVNGSVGIMSGCVFLIVDFVNDSEYVDYVNWVFFQGSGVNIINDSDDVLVVEFIEVGVYLVILIAGNDCGEYEWIIMVEVYVSL